MTNEEESILLHTQLESMKEELTLKTTELNKIKQELKVKENEIKELQENLTAERDTNETMTLKMSKELEETKVCFILHLFKILSIHLELIKTTRTRKT